MDAWLIGRDVLMVDGLEKATGQARFVADLALPDMVLARALRSAYAHARL